MSVMAQPHTWSCRLSTLGWFVMSQKHHSRGVCNEIFSISHNFLEIGGVMTYVIRTVFGVRLTFKQACLFSEHVAFQTFIMQFLTNSPLVMGWADFATSTATIKLALKAALLFNLASMNRDCCDVRLILNCSTFWSLRVVSRCLCQSWCFTSVSSYVLLFHYSHTAVPFTSAYIHILCLPPALVACFQSPPFI